MDWRNPVSTWFIIKAVHPHQRDECSEGKQPFQALFQIFFSRFSTTPTWFPTVGLCPLSTLDLRSTALQQASLLQFKKSQYPLSLLLISKVSLITFRGSSTTFFRIFFSSIRCWFVANRLSPASLLMYATRSLMCSFSVMFSLESDIPKPVSFLASSTASESASSQYFSAQSLRQFRSANNSSLSVLLLRYFILACC